MQGLDLHMQLLVGESVNRALRLHADKPKTASHFKRKQKEIT